MNTEIVKQAFIVLLIKRNKMKTFHKIGVIQVECEKVTLIQHPMKTKYSKRQIVVYGYCGRLWFIMV